MNTRRTLCWLLFFAVVGVIALIPEYFFAPHKPALALEPTAGRVSLAPEKPTQKDRASAATQAAINVPQADLFAAHSWQAVPVRPAVVQQVTLQPPPPPPPMAPPLPFTFIGKLDDSERLRVFLLRGEAVHVVGVGDLIDSDYLVEHIDATEMILVYLPLQLTQSLAVGSTR